MVNELEWKTRRDRINKKLKALKPAWEIVKYSDKLDSAKLTRHAIEEHPTAKGPADYALFVKGQFLGYPLCICKILIVGISQYISI